MPAILQIGVKKVSLVQHLAQNQSAESVSSSLPSYQEGQEFKELQAIYPNSSVATSCLYGPHFVKKDTQNRLRKPRGVRGQRRHPKLRSGACPIMSSVFEESPRRVRKQYISRKPREKWTGAPCLQYRAADARDADDASPEAYFPGLLC